MKKLNVSISLLFLLSFGCNLFAQNVQDTIRQKISSEHMRISLAASHLYFFLSKAKKKDSLEVVSGVLYGMLDKVQNKEDLNNLNKSLYGSVEKFVLNYIENHNDIAKKQLFVLNEIFHLMIKLNPEPNVNKDKIFEYLWNRSNLFFTVRKSLINFKITSYLFFDDNKEKVFFEDLKINFGYLGRISNLRSGKDFPSPKTITRYYFDALISCLNFHFPNPSYLKDKIINKIQQDLLTNQLETEELNNLKTKDNDELPAEYLKAFNFIFFPSNNIDIINFLLGNINIENLSNTLYPVKDSTENLNDYFTTIRLKLQRAPVKTKKLFFKKLLTPIIFSNLFKTFYDTIFAAYKDYFLKDDLFRYYLPLFSKSDLQSIFTDILTYTLETPKSYPSIGIVLGALGPFGYEMANALKLNGFLPQNLKDDLHDIDVYKAHLIPERIDILNKIYQFIDPNDDINILEVLEATASFYTVKVQMTNNASKKPRIFKKLILKKQNTQFINEKKRLQKLANIFSKSFNKTYNLIAEKIRKIIKLTDQLNNKKDKIDDKNQEFKQLYIHSYIASSSQYKVSSLPYYNRFNSTDAKENITIEEYNPSIVNLSSLQDLKLKTSLTVMILEKELSNLFNNYVFDFNATPENWLFDLNSNTLLYRKSFSLPSSIKFSKKDFRDIWLLMKKRKISKSTARQIAANFHSIFNINHGLIDLSKNIYKICKSKDFPPKSDIIERFYYLQRNLENNYNYLYPQLIQITFRPEFEKLFAALSQLSSFKELLGEKVYMKSLSKFIHPPKSSSGGLGGGMVISKTFQSCSSFLF